MNDNIWKCFLSLQGLTDEAEPPPPPSVHASLDHFKLGFEQSGAFEFLKGRNNLLVIGAGSGGEVKVLQDQGFNVSGTTIIYKDVKFAKKNYGIDLVLEDFHDMKSFSAGQFNGVYSSNSLEHALSPLIALFEVRRILSVGGKFFLKIPSDTIKENHGLQHYSVLSKDLWFHLFNLCGFDVVESYMCGSDLVIKTIRTNKDCPALFFETKIRKQNLWR